MPRDLDANAIEIPRPRTWRRWARLARSELTLFRALQYEAIAGLHLAGRTLDIGGGARNSYHHLLHLEGTIETINIDPGVEPTYLHDLNRPLPFAGETFDNVLSLNTFEHIRHDTLAIGEAIRVLRPGGRFVFSVPFCYRVHGSPNDYHRHTARWWLEEVRGLGVEAAQVEPLVWAARNTGAMIYRPGGMRRGVAMALPFVDPGHWARRIQTHLPRPLRTVPWRPGASRLSADDRRLALARGDADHALGYVIRGTR